MSLLSKLLSKGDLKYYCCHVVNLTGRFQVLVQEELKTTINGEGKELHLMRVTSKNSAGMTKRHMAYQNNQGLRFKSNREGNRANVNVIWCVVTRKAPIVGSKFK